jgi:alpha,alpha-trehalase
VVGNLARFERAGGLETSQLRSGAQWDAPFGWAPLQWIAVQGMRRYGHRQEADRVSRRFLSMVVKEYAKSGTLEEKYDVVHRTAAVDRSLRFGYRTNEAGFGWTNAVFTSLFDELPAADQRSVLAGR